MALVQESPKIVFGISGYIHCGSFISSCDRRAQPHAAWTLTQFHNPYTLTAEEDDLRTTANYLFIQDIFVSR